MGYLISICIPTYNRLIDLQSNLNSLVHIYGNSEIVELVISDNGSSDGTQIYLKSIAEQYSNVNCYFKDKNGGFDQNLLDVYRFAQGEYVHFCGDDDTIIFSNFDILINLLKNKSPLLVMSNYEIILLNKTGQFRVINKKSEKFSEIEALFSYTGHYITFISSLTLKKVDISNIDFSKYNGLQFMHIALVLELFNQSENKFLFNELPVARATDKNAASYSVDEYFNNKLIEYFIINSEKLDFDKLKDFFVSLIQYLIASNVSLKKIFNSKGLLYKIFGAKIFFNQKILFTIIKIFTKRNVKRILGKLK